MNSEPILYIVGSFIISLISYLLIRQLIGTYLSEKGKNLATKEDVGEITKIIEDIRMDNNSELELIKAEIVLVTKTQATVYDDERGAIINFLATITEFFQNNINLPIISDSNDEIIYLMERNKILLSEFRRVQIARSKLILLCINEDIIKSAELIILQLSEIRNTTHIARIKLLGSVKVSAAQGVAYKKTQSENDYKLYDAELSRQTLIHDEFNDKFLSFHNKYSTDYHKLLILCKNYLKTKKAV